MKIGIIQGRLLEPVNGNVQEFPTENWHNEFEIIKDLGLNHIEFIITKTSFNQLDSLNISNFAEKISALCCDHIIDSDIVNSNYINENLVPVCQKAVFGGIENINIPLLEQSSLNHDNFNEIAKNFIEISEKFPKLKFNFEIESELEIVQKFVNISENFFFVYDTGNLNYIGVDHRNYIREISKKISQVHLKDRDKNGSVRPGEGTTPFLDIFQELNNIDYGGLYTIQTARGKSGREFENIKNDLEFFKKIKSSLEYF